MLYFVAPSTVAHSRSSDARRTQQLQDLAKARAEFEQQYRERERDRPRRPPQRERDTASDAPFSMLQQVTVCSPGDSFLLPPATYLFL